MIMHAGTARPPGRRAVRSAAGALGDVAQDGAGVGSAVVTTVYFHAAGGGQPHALVFSLVAVLGRCLLRLVAVPLLPQRAAQLEH